MGHKVRITPQKAAAYRAAAEQASTAPGGAVEPSPMSDRQAEAKAKELWGVNGAAWHPCYTKKGESQYCRVGLGVGDVRDLWKPFGRGKTFEEAFLDAQRRGYC